MVEDDKIIASAKRHARAFLGIGIAQVVLGVISVILGIASVVYDRFFLVGSPHALFDSRFLTYIGAGIWAGCFLVVSGALGIQTERNPTRAVIIASLITTILTALTSGFMVVIEVFAAIFSVGWGVPITLIGVGVAGMILAVIHAGTCCDTMCCGMEYDVADDEEMP